MKKNYQSSFLLLISLLSFFTSCHSQSSISSSTPSFEKQTASQTQSITLEQVFKQSEFRPNYVYGFTYMNDGTSYSVLEHGEYPQIKQYNIKTGELIETIINGVEYHSDFTNYIFSDDEEKILLSTDVDPIYRHSTKANYYIFDRNTNQIQELTNEGKQSYPKFSPDGTKIAYVRENNIYYKDLKTGKTVTVTTDGEWNKIINGMSDWVYEEEFVLTRAFEWSPDGKKIAYFKFDESKVPTFTFMTYGDLYPEPYSYKYPKAGETNSTVTTHVYDLNSQQNKNIQTHSNNNLYFPRLTWTPQGELIICKENRHQNELQLLKVNEQSNTTTVLFEETNPYYISESFLDDIRFLETNDFIYTSEQDGYNHIYYFDTQLKKSKQLTSGNWEVTQLYGVDEKNGDVYFQAAKVSPLNREIYRVGIDGSNMMSLSNQEGTEKAQFTKTFEYFVSTFSNTTQPPVYSVKDKEGKTIRVLEDNAELKAKVDKLQLPTIEFFQFPQAGLQLNGLMMKPKNFDPNKKYPVLMYVYGGPGSQTVTNSWAPSNYWWNVILNQEDYIVVSIDNRGTGARGEKFKKSTYENLGKLEVEDQTAGANYLASLPFVDKERIGIWGWSYGGFMSSNCLFQSNDVFKTAIAVAPVTNWRYYDTVYTERFMKTPQENASGYDLNSPINYADQLKGNYLIVHGTADDNVHFQNAIDLITALNMAEKQFDIEIFPNKNHGIYGGNTRYQLFNTMTLFILENL